MVRGKVMVVKMKEDTCNLFLLTFIKLDVVFNFPSHVGVLVRKPKAYAAVFYGHDEVIKWKL